MRWWPLLLLLVATASVTSAAWRRSNGASQLSPLVEAIVKNRYPDFVKELGKAAVDLDRPDGKGRLPMLEAVRSRDIRFVDALLQYGANAGVQDPATGLAPITYAFQRSMVEIARLLLAYGADLNQADKTGAKPRDFAPSMAIHNMIKTWDVEGAAGWEDPPGTWLRVEPQEEGGHPYWHHTVTGESRWGAPPSCAWTRDVHHGAVVQYVNARTGQSSAHLPAALSWRFVRQAGEDLWYNWRANVTQYQEPGEVPQDMLHELRAAPNVRWLNAVTGEYQWEDPVHAQGWRHMQDEDGRVYYHNVVSGESVWALPADLSWEAVSSESADGEQWWHNRVTDETSWDPPVQHAWIRHDSEL